MALRINNILVITTDIIHTVLLQNCICTLDDKTGLNILKKTNMNCQAEIIKEEFYPSGCELAMPLGSPYKPFFDDAYVFNH